VVVVGDYAYLAAGNDGLRVIDVSDPVSPTEVISYSTSDYAYDVATAGDYVYLAADQGGLHVVDVSSPFSPTQVALYHGMDSVQGVAVTGDYAALVGECDEGGNCLHVVDISDPGDPTRVGFYRALAEANGVALAESGSGETYIYVAASQGGLVILRIRFCLHLPLVLRIG
jgi:hypothetical protein